MLTLPDSVNLELVFVSCRLVMSQFLSKFRAFLSIYCKYVALLLFVEEQCIIIAFIRSKFSSFFVISIECPLQVMHLNID